MAKPRVKFSVMAGQPGPAAGRPGCKLVPAIPIRRALPI